MVPLLIYLDDVISFGKSIPEALVRLEEVLARLSDFGLQLKAKKCTMQLAILTDTCVKRTLVQWGQLIPVSSTWNVVYQLCLIRTLV